MSFSSDFTREVSRLPFAGKHMIKQVSYGAMREKYTRPKVRKTLVGLGWMGFMIVSHAAQAKFGHIAFEHDATWLEYGDMSLLRKSETAYDVAYTGANTAVTIAQTYIAYRMGKSLVNTLRKPVSTEPFEAGIEADVAFKHSLRTRARNMGRTILNTLKHPLANRPYEVGIDDDVTPKGMYPAYEVGIDYPIERQRRSFKEWRQQNTDTIPLYVDLAVTSTAQAAFIASFFH